jgi:hypothetical protein
MRYDWEKIEQEYVSGKMSMEALAKKHGISISAIEKKAIERKFTEKRRIYAEKVKEKALARAQARDARTLGNLSSALDKAARTLNKYIGDDDTLFGRVSVTEDGVQEYRTKKLDTKALRDMTAAMREVSAAIKLLQPETADKEEKQEGIIILSEREDGEEEVGNRD